MKKRFLRLIAGALIGAMLTSGVVFAKQISETAELFYNNIKIYIDGGEIVPKDANGNVVEPFIMNGTTYLPVRAISNAFGKDVEWDGSTQSVYIGKKDQTKPDNYLDRIQYNDFKRGNDPRTTINIINGTVTDYNNNTYTNGILLFSEADWEKVENDKDEANIIVSYPLNSQYSSLKGKIVLPKKLELSVGTKTDCSIASTKILVYGDGKLLFTAPEVSASFPYSLDIDVKGVNQLSVKLIASDIYRYVALTDLALYK